MFGLRSNFKGMVHVLYANPDTMVSTNSLQSEPFSIEHGSWQGCLLSPMLFALSLEQLAQMKRRNGICNIQIKSSNNSISLFAHEISLYISNFEESIPNILKTFDEFSLVRGYKINCNISNLLLIKQQDGSTIPVWYDTGQSKIAYLGIIIHPSPNKTVKDIYEAVLVNL